MVAAIRFEWDDRKNAANRRKRGVAFEEAQTAFFDERALLIADLTTPRMRNDSFFSDSAAHGERDGYPLSDSD